jgi:hypothetical protein
MALKDEMDKLMDLEDPYRNYANEAIDILKRIEKKIDALLDLEEQESKRDE